MPETTRVLTCRLCSSEWNWTVQPGNYKPKLCPTCGETHKFCPRCQLPRPLSEWYLCRSSRDGKQDQCKWCRARPPKTYKCGQCSVTFTRVDRGRQQAVNLCDECETTYKWCPKCDRVLDKNEFSIANGKRSGRVSHCKSCAKLKYAALDKRERVAKKHRISVSEMVALRRAQADVCAICGLDLRKTKRGPQLDHCHATGKLREYLCHNCNLGLGNFQDSPILLKSAIAYLMKHA